MLARSCCLAPFSLCASFILKGHFAIKCLVLSHIKYFLLSDLLKKNEPGSGFKLSLLP